MVEKVLQIRNLKVEYITDGDVVNAVNGIDLDISKGETLGLVGETGAGKTTTALSILRMLPNYTAKTRSGEILLNGRNALKLKEKQMEALRGSMVSMVFQDPMSSLNPVYKVGEQIAEVLKLHEDIKNKDTLRKRVGELLEIVGIPATRQDEYPHQFSGGMKQRVMIAIAIACHPALLIADEPTTALDVTIQAQVLDMMQDLKKRLGTSILLITHDLGVVASFCDSVAIMYAGEILEYGALEDIFDFQKPHHPYTEGLFGSIPNLKIKTRRLNPIDGMMPDPTNLPDGCKFHPRCPHCTDKCKSGPVPVWNNGLHRIQCHLMVEEEKCL